MVSLKSLAFALIASCLEVAGPAIAGEEEHLIQLLESRQCPACRLNDVDLTHVDLRDADLKGAHLQRGNLSQARLDGTDLNGSDLSFTSLQGLIARHRPRNSRSTEQICAAPTSAVRNWIRWPMSRPTGPGHRESARSPQPRQPPQRG